MDNLIDGKSLAQKIKDEIKKEVSTLKSRPTLAFILVGNDKSSEIYIKNKKIACEYIGINPVGYRLSADVSESELLNLIDKLNKDKDIHSILVQHPLPSHIDEKNVSNKIDFKKDADCFNPYNIGLFLSGGTSLLPCTPSACIEILKQHKIDLAGKVCTVIGRSNIVGKPLINMLIQKQATVLCANSKTPDLKSLTKSSDIVFVAVGKPNFLTKDMIKDGAIIIDVGINKINDAIVGDCCFSGCKEKAKLITPVPGGVGPLTVAMLMKNCLTSYKLQNEL